MRPALVVLSGLVVAVATGPARTVRRRAVARPVRQVGGPRTPAWVPVAVAGSAGLAVGGIVPGVVAGGAALVLPVLVREVRGRRQRAAVAAAVPDLVELFLVAASAGRTVAASLAVIATRAPPPVAAAVARARHRFDRGRPLAECLAELGEALGPGGAPLVDALGQSLTAGVPLVPLLEGVAAAARDERRRRAQAAARRLPVTMLFPLVGCVLPAALLLAVVPVLVASVSSLAP